MSHPWTLTTRGKLLSNGPDLLGDRDSQRPRFSVRDTVLVLIKADWGANHDINGVVEVGARSCQRILPGRILKPPESGLAGNTAGPTQAGGSLCEMANRQMHPSDAGSTQIDPLLRFEVFQNTSIIAR